MCAGEVACNTPAGPRVLSVRLGEGRCTYVRAARCPGRESNPHASRPPLLRRLCLPFHHPGAGATVTARVITRMVLSARWSARYGWGDLGKTLPGIMQFAEGDHLAPEEQGQGPVVDDPYLAVDAGDPRQVVRAVHEPGREALELDPVHLGDALVQTEAGHRAGVLVPVLDRGPSAQDADEVAGQARGLAYRVLCARPAQRARFLGQVRYRRGVPGRPGARYHLPVRVGHLEGGQAADPALLVQWQVGVADHRVGLDAGGPHDRVGLEGVAVGQAYQAADAGLQAGTQPDVQAPAQEFLDRVRAHVRVDLGQDPLGGLDQYPVHLVGVELRVVAQRVAGHVLQFGERLDAGVPAADEHERQGRRPGGLVGGGGRDVEPFQYLVAQVDGLADGLETDRLLAQPGDRQGTGDAAGGDDDLVVRHLAGRADDRLDVRDPAGVFDPGDVPGQDVAAGQLPAQRHDRVPGRDVAGGDFGQERLVRHVRLRIDDDHFRLAPPELAGQAQGRVQPDVPGADDQNPLRVHGSIIDHASGERAFAGGEGDPANGARPAGPGTRRSGPSGRGRPARPAGTGR